MIEPMAIDRNIYNNGIKGLLSYYEIDSLSRDYEMYKGMFREATETRTGIPFNKMSRLDDKSTVNKCDEYEKMTRWQRFKMKMKFVFNVRRWWNLFQLIRELRKKWKTERNLK
jgi:hypothetical protein